MPTVEQGPGGSYIVYGRGYGKKGTLIQTDYAFPVVAQDLGWNIRRVQVDRRGGVGHFKRVPKGGCPHRGTDGTVKCPDCGLTATDFISAAAEFLDSKAY
jgi:hypothetical protein